MTGVDWSDVKSAVRGLPFIEPAWAWGRGLEQQLRYRSFARCNAAEADEQGLVYSEGAVRRLVAERLTSRGLAVSPRPKGALRTLWVGAFEPSDRSVTIQALERLGPVTCFAGSEGYGPARGGKWDENGRALVETARASAPPDSRSAARRCAAGWRSPASTAPAARGAPRGPSR